MVYELKIFFLNDLYLSDKVLVFFLKLKYDFLDALLIALNVEVRIIRLNSFEP